MNGPLIAWLPDGRRLHMNHGPIDLIVEAFGAEDERRAAYAQAAGRFCEILDELVAELPELRRPAAEGKPRRFASPTALRMEAACVPLAGDFLTPMAAVAGSVADEILAALTAGRELDRAYVNNGGDAAIHLGRGQSIRLAVVGTGHGLADRAEIGWNSPVRGIATSGWRGRSFSLGIADAVTILARTGAEADAAATIIANAVDLPGHRAIRRKPANEMAPDSDLGGRLVTVHVGQLGRREIAAALERGRAVAENLRDRGLVEAAALFLGGEVRTSDSSEVAYLRAPLWPAGHLPHKGGDQLSHKLSPIAVVTGEAATSKLPISPLVGEMAGRPEGGNVGHLPLHKRDPLPHVSRGRKHA